MRRTALAAAVVLASCGDSSTPGFSTGPGVTSVPQTSSSTAGSTSGSSSTSGDSGEDSAAASSGSSGGRLDMGPPPDFGDVQPPGCKGKIDFLFLIARNGTMITEQEQLLASVPGFINTITASFPDFDTHIMVANPDGGWPGWVCEKPELCGTYGYCGPNGMDYVCGPDTWLTVTECDETLGAGITFNAGGYATNKRCELYGDHRYITIPGEPDPAAAFDCIARVGKSGGDTLGDALVAAVSPELNGPEGCNAGFLRPDALLVVTMIMDTEDEDSKLKPADWHAAVVAAKGSAASVVMLAILPQPHDGEPPPGCTKDELGDKEPLRALINLFPFHAEGDTCAPTYVPFFEQAVSLVGEACDSFIPQ